MKESRYGTTEHVYNPESHLAVIFNLYGSVWPKVIMYCILNSLFTFLIVYLREKKNIDLTFSSKGHLFMSLMVSFLVVTRAKVVYSRYMEGRGHLSSAMRSCREIVQHACILSMFQKTDLIKQWRSDVAFWTIMVLRALCATIEFESNNLAEKLFDAKELDSVRGVIDSYIFDGDFNTEEDSSTNRIRNSNSKHRALAHGVRRPEDEVLRIPLLLSYTLREKIISSRNDGVLSTPFHINEELKILQFVGEFNAAYHGLRKLIRTPYPFPLIQMTRTFLFVWVFTLPFSLVGDMDEGRSIHYSIVIIMFFITYGFIGLEHVSIELEDPWGDEPNDFDDLGMAEIVFDDIYINITDIDGFEAGKLLKDRVEGGFNPLANAKLIVDLERKAKRAKATTLQSHLENKSNSPVEDDTFPEDMDVASCFSKGQNAPSVNYKADDEASLSNSTRRKRNKLRTLKAFGKKMSRKNNTSEM